MAKQQQRTPNCWCDQMPFSQNQCCSFKKVQTEFSPLQTASKEIVKPEKRWDRRSWIRLIKCISKKKKYILLRQELYSKKRQSLQYLKYHKQLPVSGRCHQGSTISLDENTSFWLGTWMLKISRAVSTIQLI